MGFTEAELGFVLAALFAAIGVAYQNDKTAAEKETEGGKTQHAIDSVDLARTKKELDSVKREIALAFKGQGRRSNLTPPCAEKGEPETPIAQITVLGPDQYRMGDMELGFAGVEQQLSSYIAKQSKLGCKYNVQVKPMPGVDAPVHSAATKRLRNLFYVRES